MYPPPIVTLPQAHDQSARRELPFNGAALIYISARSRDTLAANAPNQDFVAFRYSTDQIVFAVCDGVSQSFYGDIASRFLGTRLVKWLWECEQQALEPFLADLNAALREWTTEATARVEAKVIRPDLPEMQRIALERKRVNGSESMFVGGQINLVSQTVALCWLGDSRLQLWDKDNHPIDIPGVEWDTRLRWSSRVGPKNGTAGGVIMPLDSIGRITAHTDGVGKFAETFAQLAQDQLDPMVEVLRRSPTSDDVSVLDVNLDFPPQYNGWYQLQSSAIAATDSTFTWNPVPFAGTYRVSVDDGDQPFTVEFPAEVNSYSLPIAPELPDSSQHTFTCSIQALNDYALASPWSEPVTISVPIGVVGESSSAVHETKEPVPVSRTRPTKPRRRRRRSRLQAFLILLVSAMLMAVFTTAAWLFQQTFWGWFNALLDSIHRM